MEDPQPVALSAPQKRSLEDDVDAALSTPTKPPPSDASTPLSVLSTVPSPSPVKVSTSYASAPASSNNSAAGDAPAPTQGAAASSTAQHAAKRRKLTIMEQEEKRKEKESKEKAKAEKKAQRELKAEQKAQKEEEKRLKDEEKRKKNEEKEEKKKAKEFEQQQKEEEKRKKERSQMRLNAFFVKPKPSGGSSRIAPVDAIQNPTTESTSLAPGIPAPIPDANSAPASPQRSPQRKAQVEYERYFLPFSLPSHAILAPYNRYMEDPVKLASASSRLDHLISEAQVNKEPINLESFKSSFPTRGPRGLKIVPIVEIVERVNGSSNNPIDLTDNEGAGSQPLDLLENIPMKYLHFSEDVRPPYYGTYTKPHNQREASKLARNPFSRTLHETDYDYDSEAEWDEPEEGEDLDSDGDDDLDDEGEDDMDGFLDDEDDPQLKRRLISGDLQPISTGLCWEDRRGVSRLNDGSGAISTEFNEFRMSFLLEPHPQSIDPFSTAYWAPDPTSAAKTFAVPSKEGVGNSLMNPPRLPLTQRPVNGMLNTANTPSDKASSALSKPAKPPKRQIPTDQLPAFKAEVEGSDLTKIALVESLKKKFPKLPKDAISNTLSSVAARVGAKEVDKRWVLLK